ncbi:MAG: hypothetical protein AAGI50_00575 [Pseudomonadota bacterium]
MLSALLDEHARPHRITQAARIEMNRALERLLVGEDVAQADFLVLGQAYGAAEAELGRVIAQRFGEIAASLTPVQQDGLAVIRAAHAAGQPDRVPEARARVRLPDVDRQELVNLAARFLSWTTGSPDLNDFEVVGKPSQHFGFVNLRLASGHSVRRGAVAAEVLDLLTPDQHLILDVAVRQNVALFPEFLSVRADLMRVLEVALIGEPIDRDTVARLGAGVGEIEARMTWAQATAMLSVRDTLTADQLEALLALRARYTVAEAGGVQPDGVDQGRRLFAHCVLCHAPSQGDAVAPSLAGIVGREIASDAEYRHYSPALQRFAQSEGSWSIDLLDAFLRSPRAVVPGTTMGFDGFDAEQDRTALLDYLATLD